MLIVCWQYTGAFLRLCKLSVSVHLPLPTGPGQSWGKQGSQVVHWQAAPNRPSFVCLSRGVLGESGVVLSPLFLSWLVEAPPFPDHRPSRRGVITGRRPPTPPPGTSGLREV